MKGLFKSAGYQLVRMALLSLIAVSVYAVNASGATLVYSNTLAGLYPGTSEALLQNPFGMAVDSLGNVYVADDDDDLVVEYNSSGTYVASPGRTGNRPLSPYGVAVDSSYNVYIADSGNSRIIKLNSSGGDVLTFGTLGTGNSQFQYPYGVAVDSSNNIYVCDTYNHRIQEFNSSWTYVRTLGTTGVIGTDNSHFDYPQGIAVDSSKNVYVADTYNDRIQIFNSSGTYVGTLGVPGVTGSDNSHFTWPTGVAVDSSGNIYVADQQNERVQEFNSSYTYVTTLGVSGASGSDNSHFWNPSGVAVDRSGNVYVSDTLNARVQEYSLSSTPTSGSCGSSNGADLTSAPTANLCSTGSASSVSGSGPWTWICSGTNGGTNASCSASLVTNGSCGSSNGESLTSAPSTNLCSAGTASSVSGSGPWNWTCAGINTGTTASCSASLVTATNGACGSSNGADLTAAPTANLCTTGTASSVSGSGPWTWTCNGANGGTNAGCSASLKTNGACGSSNGESLTAAPSSNLCSAGTASSVSGSGPWTWTCAGINTGTTASCTASLLTPTNGACGSSNGADLTAAPSTNLCTAGTASAVSGSGPWTWSCAGANTGTTASCSASLVTNGACGSSNGESLAAAPTTNLCSTGTASAVSGSGPWTWSCVGANTGTTAGCSASALTNGACGSSNGADLTAAPSANLCSAGTASAVSGSGPWTWSCTGANNGTNASCTAYLASQTGTGLLPDTGQTSCVNFNGFGISCAGTGQDGAYILNPMSYTNNGNSTVTDNVTGLMWQQQSGTNMSWSNAGAYCTGLSVGNHTDWRLPSVMELISIVNYGIQSTGPMINSTYFLNTAASSYWSSTPDAGNTSNAWEMNFSAGTSFTSAMSGNAYVRCVRGGQLKIGNFTDNKDGTVSDSATGLMWQQAEGGLDLWSSGTNVSGSGLVYALSYCTGLSLGRHSDWRLPNVKELASIVDYAQYNPEINTAFFPNAAVNIYWASTPQATFASIAWGVEFFNGSVTYSSMSDSYNVRCVRGGQSGSLGNLVLSLSEAGTGSGTVTSSPSGISCGATCSASFSSGTSVTLTAAANSGSTFTGWSGGGCSGTGTCTVTMTAATSVTATFGTAIPPTNGACGSSNGAHLTAAPTANLCSAGTASAVSGSGPWTWTCNGANNGTNASCTATSSTCANLPVILVGPTAAYYPLLQSAYNAAASGDTIESQAGIFAEDLNFNSNISVTLQGGYNCGYLTISSYSVINGTLTISGGPVTFDYIKIQ